MSLIFWVQTIYDDKYLVQGAANLLIPCANFFTHEIRGANKVKEFIDIKDIIVFRTISNEQINNILSAMRHF